MNEQLSKEAARGYIGQFFDDGKKNYQQRTDFLIAALNELHAIDKMDRNQIETLREAYTILLELQEDEIQSQVKVTDILKKSLEIVDAMDNQLD